MACTSPQGHTTCSIQLTGTLFFSSFNFFFFAHRLSETSQISLAKATGEIKVRGCLFVFFAPIAYMRTTLVSCGSRNGMWPSNLQLPDANYVSP
jgi:hypothetical protein